jgi:hypothetical protein
MKQNLVFGFFLLFILFFSTSLFSQDFKTEALPGVGDSTSFLIEYAPLPKKTKAQPTTPFYQHLYIFGDGNFKFGQGETADTVQHLYRSTPATDNLPTFFPRAYSNGLYSEDDELPPTKKIVIVNPDGSLTAEPTRVVDPGRYVKILRNVEVKPGDNFVNILAVRNPGPNSFTGQLYFFYNGRLREVSKKGTRQLVDYGDFTIRENFAYQGSSTENTYHYSNFPAGDLRDRFTKMMVFQVSELDTTRELHFFIDMEGKETMTKYFADTTMAQLDFAVALGSFSDDLQAVIPDSLVDKFDDLSLNTNLVAIEQSGNLPDSLVRYDASGDTTTATIVTQGPGLSMGAFVDYYESTATLVKSHDPNYLVMEACACEGEQDQYQIFTTINCENNGYGETSNVFIDMKLPEGITADQVAATPVRYHPFNGPSDQIRLIRLTDDSIRWELLNFGIEGTPIHGSGDPRTYARVQFNMYTDVLPANLDSTYACIRFDKLENTPVCTVPVGVTLVTAEDTDSTTMSCGTGGCNDIPPAESTLGLPWWLILLLVLILLLIFIWLIRRNNGN